MTQLFGVRAYVLYRPRPIEHHVAAGHLVFLETIPRTDDCHAGCDEVVSEGAPRWLAASEPASVEEDKCRPGRIALAAPYEKSLTRMSAVLELKW